jgi:hypothetical protein
MLRALARLTAALVPLRWAGVTDHGVVIPVGTVMLHSEFGGKEPSVRVRLSTDAFTERLAFIWAHPAE